MYDPNNYRGFYKVSESGFSLTSAVFFNPETKEHFSKIVWDIDNDRLLDDEEIQFLRMLPINKEVEIEYKHFRGGFIVGDMVEVVRGRKVPKGTILRVFWKGERPTYRSRNLSWSRETETIAGCFDENGDKVWIKAEYLKYVPAA